MLKRKIVVMALLGGFVVSVNSVGANHRSDNSVRKDVDNVLDAYINLDDDVGFYVEDGYVTLVGTVDNKAEKDLAQKLVGNISGVHKINNRLQVEGRGNEAYKANNDIRTDKEIRDDIERRLLISPELDSEKINTRVVGGTVTFTGTVNESSDMRLVERKAREAGAAEIINRLYVSRSNYKASL